MEGKLPCFKIWEDDHFMAFLDINPTCKGQTLVIPKKHYESDLFLIEDGKFYQDYLLATQGVVNLLKKGLGVHRVAMVAEWLEVPHLHLRLYPLYEGIPMSVENWEQADMEELGALQVQINNAVALN